MRSTTDQSSVRRFSERGARERDSKDCGDLPGRSGGLGPGVLDALGFVEDRHFPDPILKLVSRTKENVVGGEHHHSAVDPLQRPARPVVEMDIEIGGVPAKQGVPVFEDPSGADHQEPLGSSDLVDQAEQAHDLVGLPEPHVVGEERPDSSEIAIPQPRHAFALVRAEAGPETGWVGTLGRRPALEEICERGETVVAAGDRETGLGRPAGSRRSSCPAVP